MFSPLRPIFLPARICFWAEVRAVSWVGRAADALWNPWLLGLFLFTGLVYSLGSGFFQLFGLPLWLRAALGGLFRREKGAKRGLSPLQSLATALASTMGTGSIAGVATALTLGGPGAVFWMWASAWLGMMTGFGEKLLSVRFQRPAPGGGMQGGPMFYLRDGLGWHGAALWFTLACLPATLAGGDLVQSSSIAQALESSFALPRLATGLVTAALAALVLMGGVGRIARVSSALVPAMALLYLGAGGWVLLCRATALPGALKLIFLCALSPRAALGGGAGWTVASALRYGVARGVFTNEAGLGPSAMAHGAADHACPVRQGFWGMFEVALATLLVCSVTALVILVSGVWQPGSPKALTGTSLTAAAFSSVLGPAGSWTVSLCLLLFAFSSILGWSYYGQQCLRYLTGDDRLLPLYRALFLLCIPLGAVWENAVVWELVDLCNALMALPNLVGLIVLAPTALGELRTKISWRF